MINDSAKNLLALLNSLPPAPSVTFRGHIDTSVTKPRAIVSPTLTATSHSIAIATNNLTRPQVAVFVGANGRDLSPIMAGAPGCNLQEVTYLPGTYFLQHTCQEFSGITIQVFEEMQLASGGDALRPARSLDSWDPILIVLEPALRAARAHRLALPKGASDRFLSPIQ